MPMTNATVTLPPPAAWPEALQREFLTDQFSSAVGSVLVSETDRLRVWHLRLPPGKRCNFHRHVLNYFWTAHNAGQARGFYHDGRVLDVAHHAGETKHFEFRLGEFFVHSVENIGTTELLFTTVEFKDSANSPLPVMEAMRLVAA